MFKNKERAKTIQAQIDDVLLTLGKYEPDSPEYKQLFHTLEVLNKLNPTKDRSVSPDAIVAAAASLGGILLIVSYEHLHPIASKALGFVMKVK